MTKIMVCGEAWGRKELLFEHAFVGGSGAELARMLGEAKILPGPKVPYPSELDMINHWKHVKETEDFSLGNVFSCHPPDNKIEEFFTSVKEGGLTSLPPLKPGKYLRPEYLGHVQALWHQIETEKPTLVIAMGNTSCWALLGEGKISAIRGTVNMSERLGVKVLPTYHPAFILRQWNLRPIVVSDLEKAKREAEFPEIRRPKRYIITNPTFDEIIEWSSRPADFYAVDIETASHEIPMRQITMIGFARAPDDAIVIPFVDPAKPKWNYWSTVTEELWAWELVKNLLTKPIPKVFQNGIYDLSYILRIGIRPTCCGEDTMLFHHALYPEMLKGLGFLGSIYADDIAWKPMRTVQTLKRDE
jgi:uracil-DNA glycosylase